MAGKIKGISSRKQGRFQRGLNSEINVTPFVDVMLVLLVIFMVTSPMLITGVTVDLPKTTSMPVPGQDEPLTVSINKQGEIYIYDSKINPSELVIKLKAITGERYESRIFVRGDKSIDYGTIMQMVSNIHMAGFRRVALVTDTSALSNSDKKGS